MSIVLHEVSGPVARVTLNRPETRNPTSIAMLDGLDAALDAVAAAGGVRVVIVRGAGKSFCSGLDLSEVRADEATIRTLLRRLSEVMRRLRRLPPVTIAEVRGAAIGGGFGFVAAADFAVTHPEAKIGYPPLETGLSPALMAPWLVRKVGPGRARAMLMSGGTISGQAAFDAGIVTHVTGAAQLPVAVDELAAAILESPPAAMSEMKAFLNELDDSTSDAMLDRAATVSADVIAHAETQTRLREMFG